MTFKNTTDSVSLPETFMRHAQMLRMTTAEHGTRDVSFEISYLLPDHPHVIGLPFTHYLEKDYFSAGETLLTRLDDLIKRSYTLLNEESAQRLLHDFATVSDEIKQHIIRVTNTPDDFILPFKGLLPEERKEAIEDVPLKKLRDFLRMWETKIDGPLEQVKVGMKKSEPSEMRQDFLHALKNTSRPLTTSITLLGTKPPKNTLH